MIRCVTRKLLACLLVAAILPASIGLVFVPVTPAKVSISPTASKPYSCFGMNCGCVDEESCRTHCCCHPDQADSNNEPAEIAASPADGSSLPALSLRLEHRSPSCAGKSPSILAGDVNWQVPDETPIDFTLPLILVESPHRESLPVARSLDVSSPPPRPARIV
jgi:hypothetical protein